MQTTRLLAEFATEARPQDLPPAVLREGPRCVINWLGCVYGGIGDAVGDTGFRALWDMAGNGAATVIGRQSSCDTANAAFFNVLNSSAHGYDDAHLQTIAHPGGPAVSSALATAEMLSAEGMPVDGPAFLHAVLLGVEVQCRVSRALVAGPVPLPIGFYMTGLTGAMGAAVAAGSVLRLDAAQMAAAIGLAAAQGAGFRETHTSMASPFVRAQAARNGVTAALLARAGFTSTPTALEGEKGFFAVFASKDSAALTTERLGEDWALLDVDYKRYPCAMVINPVLDACLDLARSESQAQVQSVRIHAHPVALQLCGVRAPRDIDEARHSIYHWVAAALVRRRAGLAEIAAESLTDPALLAFRDRIEVIADPAMPRGAARVQARLADGRDITREAAEGAATAQMPDAELDAKFHEQADPKIGPDPAGRIVRLCRDLPDSPQAPGPTLAALLR